MVEFIIISVLAIAGMIFWECVKSSTKGATPRVVQQVPARPLPKVPVVSAAWAEKGIDAIDRMTGVQFEVYVAGMLRSLGRKVTMTPTVGDFGVDLIVDDLFAVQCKRQSKPVGTAAVQEVTAGARMHNCSQLTFIVSNQTFTPAAVKLANVTSCGLYGRDNFADFLDVMRAVAKSQERQESDELPTVQRAMKRTTVRPPKAKKAT
ncbi:restriction endonuclease [Mycolicibacterium elephantis]